MTARLSWCSLVQAPELAQRKQMQGQEMGGETMRRCPMDAQIL